MRTDELWQLGERYVPNFVGVYPLDKLPRRLEAPANLIINTHTHNLPGEHWLAVSYQRGGLIYAFDSFGFYYPLILRNYLQRLRARTRSTCQVHYSDQPLQHYKEMTCGLYCVAWLICINSSSNNNNK